MKFIIKPKKSNGITDTVYNMFLMFTKVMALYKPTLFSRTFIIFLFSTYLSELLEHVQDEVFPFKSYLQRYPTPHLSCKSSSPMWYAIRRASAHIIVLSSYSPFGTFSSSLQLLYSS